MRLILTLSALLCTIIAADVLHAQDVVALPDSIVTKNEAKVGVTVSGKFDEEASLAMSSRNSQIRIGEADATNFRTTFDWLPESGYMMIWVKAESEKPTGTTKAASYVSLQAQNTGNAIMVNRPDWDEEAAKWSRGSRMAFVYRPYGRKSAPRIDADDIPTDRFTGHWQQMQIDVTPQNVTIWLEGRVVRSVDFPDNSGSGPIHIGFAGQVQKLRNVEVTPYKDDSLFRPVDFSDIANDSFTYANRSRTIEHNGVTFELARDAKSLLNLKNARWIDQPRDPQSYYEEYDGGPPFIYDDRMPFLRIRKADYVAAHLLAVCEDDEAFTNNITIRAGAYGYNGQVLREDFTASVPRVSEVAAMADDEKVALRRDHVSHVVVPFDRIIEQDLLNDYLEMEITKELRPARHIPDPNRFRFRPLGLPSGVKIAAITMELSPLQARVYSPETAHAFVEPTKPQMRVDLTNITETEQTYSIEATATHIHGKTVTTSPVTGKVAPDETVTVSVPFKLPIRGYYDVLLDISNGDGRKLLTRKTSLALLPADTRKHRDASPFGTWDWRGGHVTVRETDLVGSMFKKLGFRYGMTKYTPEERARWGMLPGFEPTVDPELKNVKAYAEKSDSKKKALIFHENSISGGHVTRVPDMFTDRPPYKLSEREEQTFAKLWNIATVGGKKMREEYPDWLIKLGNGPLPTKELMYQRKFPAELFDAAGNEPGSFHRLPETQPPDYVAYNASIFMDRKMLDHYGYGEKIVRQCFEVGYPGSNPTNHSEATQADYFVRLCLHSLGWEMPFIHVGMINDGGNSYYYSNWGSTGFANRIPDASVKPAFVALSNMTLALDGAKLVEDIDTGSPSLFLLSFKRPDGKTVVAYWTVRGRRDVTLNVTGDDWTIMTDQGNDVVPTTSGDKVTISLGTSPYYLIGSGDIKGVASVGSPAYDEAPGDDAVVVDKLNNLDDWQIVKQRNPELESYNFMTPRRQGDFTFKPVKAFEGKNNVISVKANPVQTGTEYMPMYMELAHKQGGVELPGKPTEIGLWVNGNSGWGRIIYELEDASGQTWKSIGRAAAGDPHPWLLDWMTPEMLAELGTPQNNDWNTNDAYQHSRFNFDGWRYVAFPLPGNYIHENHSWPGNCNYKISGDGVVKYPLKVTKLIFELPEKVLHIQRYEPPKRPEVYFTNLSVTDRGKPMIP